MKNLLEKKIWLSEKLLKDTAIKWDGNSKFSQRKIYGGDNIE